MIGNTLISTLLTRGQPWLANALSHEITLEDLTRPRTPGCGEGDAANPESLAPLLAAARGETSGRATQARGWHQEVTGNVQYRTRTSTRAFCPGH